MGIFLTLVYIILCRETLQIFLFNKYGPKVHAFVVIPVEQRIREVYNFLKKIDPSLHYEVVPIDDPFGPTQHDPDMDLIVVSAETLRGGHNELRISK